MLSYVSYVTLDGIASVKILHYISVVIFYLIKIIDFKLFIFCFGIIIAVKFKNWVLLALYKDASFLRDAVAYKMYHKLFSGYASDSKLVELEVNGTYMGVYLL
ncbi:MAG: CotH kinase family protein, partial [Treponema sp.]|nr:CotH kinase family protein [Treponema sp.]